MAIKLTTAREAAQLSGIKVCVYGPAGAGKTYLCRTLPENSILISAESGLLSLRDTDIPVVEITTIQDIQEVYSFLFSAEGQQYTTVAIDSLSEIAEKVLANAKAEAPDPRQAYGALQDEMYQLIRAFRDLPGRNVYMSAKAERIKDDATGVTTWQPSLPGAKLSQSIGYFFDELFALRLHEFPDGAVERALQTTSDFQWSAKDRSGALARFEQPDLSAIFEKIRAGGRAEPETRPALGDAQATEKFTPPTDDGPVES